MARKDINLSDKEWGLLKQQCDLTCSDENAVKARIRKVMLSINAMDLGGPPGAIAGKVAGVSDQRWLVSGVLVAIEAKWDVLLRGGPTAIQSKYLADIELHEGVGLVIDRNNISYFEKQVLIKDWTFFSSFGVQHKKADYVYYEWLHHSWCAKEIVEVTI